jgi:hypothetical protein
MSVVRFPAPANEPPPEEDFEYSDRDAPDAPPPTPEPSPNQAGPRKTAWQALNAEAIFAPLEAVNYLIEPLDLCPGAPALVAGYGFTGKTVALQSAAIAIASGQRVWGAFAARRGRVLHIDYEQGARLTRERYQRLAMAMMVTPDELEGRLELVSLPQVYLDSPAAEGFLVDKVKGFDLAIVDSLRAAGPTLEENDSAVRGMLDGLNRVSERTGCCFVVVHHARKPSQNATGGAKMAIRGSGAIFDACSSVLILEAEKGQPTKVTHEKARASGVCTDDFVLHVEDQEIDGNPRAGLIVTAERRPAAATPAASGVFRAVMERVLNELIKGPAATKSALVERVAGNRTAKFGAIDQLLADGKIVMEGKSLRIADSA